MIDDAKILPFGKGESSVQSYNARILERIEGVEAYSATPDLRWKSGVLEQAYVAPSGAMQWIQVPDAAELPQ